MDVLGLMGAAALCPYVWRWIVQVFCAGGIVGAIVGFTAGRASAAEPSPLDRPLPPIERGPELTAKLERAHPGEVVELPEGTYTGSWRVRIPGIELQPAPGARVVLTLRDPRFSAPGAPWEPIEGKPNVYRVPEVLGLTLHRWDGRRVMYARDAAHFDLLVSERTAAALRGTAETRLYLEGEDPRKTSLWVSSSDGAILTCEASGFVLRGVELWFGGSQDLDLRAGCDDPEIAENVFVAGLVGVRAKDGLARRVTLADNWLWSSNDPRWPYRDVKGNRLMEGGAIAVPGERPRIVGNIIRGWFNGIGIACPSSCATADPEIAGNYLEDIADDAIEADGVVARGIIEGNGGDRLFVALSFAPRLVQTPGEPTLIRGNHFRATYWHHPERDGSLVRPSVTKFNGGPAQDLEFESNTFYGDGDVARGAPSGSPVQYPMRVRWQGNVIASRNGPLVRHTGSPADGNLFQGNVYVLEVPAPNAFTNWALPLGQTSQAATLTAARSSAAGRAAGWEGQGVQLGSMSEADRGAFPRGERRIDSRRTLATGWIQVRGAGFQPGDFPIVVSGALALERVARRPGVPVGARISP